MISAARLAELLKDAASEYDAAYNCNDHEAGRFWGPMKDALYELQQLRAQGLSQEDRAALEAGVAAIEFVKSGVMPKGFKGKRCSVWHEYAAILRRLGGQTT